MYFMHADSIWSVHTSLYPLVVVVDNVLSMKSNPERIEKLTSGIEQRLASNSESEMPEIAAWREAFSKMGLKPTQYRCASEALLRRYRKEKNMPSFHPLVDYLNFVSMSFAIPIAAFDCDNIVDGITVRPANGSETYVTFKGDIEHPAPNEIIFADAEDNAHARRWTHRQSAKSVVTSTTDRVLLVVEALHSSAAQDILALEQELVSELTEGNTHIITSTKISSKEPRFEF